MQITKKLYATLIITVLTLSAIMAAIPLASAINVPTFTPDFFPGNTAYTTGDVTGDGATHFGKVEVYWDTLGDKLAEGYADGTGAYSIGITIPEDIAGDHDIIVYDVLASDINSVTFTLVPSVIPLATAALPGDSVTVLGSGFGEELDVGIGLGAEVVETDEAVGTGNGATTDFALDYAPVKPGSVTVSAPGVGEELFETGDGTTSTATEITVTAPTNTANFTAGLYDEAGTTQLVAPTASVGDDATPDTVVLTYAYVDSTNYTVRITFATETGDYTLADDGNPAGTGGPITIAEIAYTLNYATGEIEFDTAPANGLSITATYTHYEYDVTPAGAESSELGSFMETFVVPAIAEVDYGTYTITAIDAEQNMSAYTGFPPFLPAFTVDYYITVTPSAGPTGITITIEGRIESDTDYEIRFGSASIATGTSGATGTFTATYVIPDVLPEGGYSVSVVWLVTKTKTATFTVTPAPKLTSIVPPSGMPGDVITISGENFTASADIELYLGTTLVNSTADDDRFGPTGGPGPNAGKIVDLEFTVPAIAPGIYVLKVIDENGASTGTEHTFTVTAAPESDVALRGTTYYRGDILSFDIATTEDNLGTMIVTIRDPSGATWWTVTAVTSGAGPWTLTGTVNKRILYQDQIINGNPLTLPADAPLGNWNWTVTYTPQSTGTETKATGLFAVAAPPTMQTIVDQLNANTTTLLDAINSCCDDLTALLEALDGKVTAIDGNVATVQTTLGSVQTTVSSLGGTISGFDGDMATIKTDLGTVKTTVSSLDVVLGVVAGDTAYLKSAISNMTGTITDIDDTVATIETDIGTLRMDVASVQSDVEDSLPVTVDMMPVWIAVILSLIAAIAAIFAVVTIRQKIAG
jgi:hypothetical protein